MEKILNFRKYGEEGKFIFILHGLFGMLDNWTSIGRKLRKDFRVILVDQRNHGKSFHDKEMSYTAMANDLKKLMDHLEVEKATIVGHSMGGKAVMQFAADFPECVENLVVVDIAPKAYLHGHTQIFDAFNKFEIEKVESRRDADELMEPFLSDFGVRQFILKNLARDKDGTYFWRPAIRIIEENYPNIVAEVPFDFKGQTIFVRGTKSAYISDEDVEELKSLNENVEVADIESGHWVHAEKRDEFLKHLLTFLNVS